MARTTLIGPPNNSMELNTGDAAERGMSPKQVVDAVNGMFSEMYGTAASIQRMRRIATQALVNSPYQLPARTLDPPTITVSASSDGSLGPIQQMASGSALSAAGQRVSWYGGVPDISAGAYVRLPVATTLPAVAGNAGGSNNAWSGAAEIMVDGPAVEFCFFHNNTKFVQFQQDGQYTDFAGWAGLAGANADTLIKLVWSTRKLRRIRAMMPTTNASGQSMLKFIRVSALGSFSKPSQADVVKMGFFGDSYGEGTNGALTVQPYPMASWPTLLGELLGFRDVRQCCIGGSGYLATLAGTRSKLRDAIPLLAAQGPFDIIVIAHGYNDSANTPAAIQAEATLAIALMRATYPTTPIVVLGCQAGNAGPSAAQINTELAISAAVTAQNDQYIKFAPVSTDAQTWFNGTGKVGATNGTGNSDVYVDPDGVHPSGPQGGEEYLALRSREAVMTALASMV